MLYFSAKDDLRFMEAFKGAIERYYQDKQVEDELTDENNYPFVMTDELATRIDHELRRTRTNVQDLRNRLVRDTPRATRIAGRLGARIIMVSHPAPINAYLLPVVHQNKFEAIFHDATYGEQIRSQHVLDCANETLALLEDEVEAERNKLKNPLYWIWMLVTFIIRLPYNLVKLSGFDVDKFQDHFFGKLFTTIFQIIWILFLVALFLYLGVGKDQIAEWVKKIPPR